MRPSLEPPKPDYRARSPVYSVPTVIGRTRGEGAFIRGKSGRVEDVIVGGEGLELTAKELERRAIIIAEENEVELTDHNIGVRAEGDAEFAVTLDPKNKTKSFRNKTGERTASMRGAGRKLREFK